MQALINKAITIKKRAHFLKQAMGCFKVDRSGRRSGDALAPSPESSGAHGKSCQAGGTGNGGCLADMNGPIGVEGPVVDRQDVAIPSDVHPAEIRGVHVIGPDAEGDVAPRFLTGGTSCEVTDTSAERTHRTRGADGLGNLRDGGVRIEVLQVDVLYAG